MIAFEHVFHTYHAAHEGKGKHRGGEPPEAAWGNKPDAYWALMDVSFTLQDGEFLGIAGHTGSGKSTLIQHMNGLVHPTTGRVLVNGIDIAGKAEAAAARTDVGVVFQHPESQLFAPTVFDDVAFGPRNKGLSEEETRSRVENALRQVELDFEAVGGKSPFELSGGQQRRVAFAGVLAMEPHTLILDEPVAGLDPESRREFLDLIADLHRRDGLTVAMVSHDMDDLARFCDRILVLNTGQLHALGTPSEVFANAAELKRIGLDVPPAQGLASALRTSGVPVPEGLHDVDSLADALASLAKSAV